MMCCLSANLEASPVFAPFRESSPKRISLLGVEYLHQRTAAGHDVYLTKYGRPFREQLDPANWYAPDWFNAHRRRLPGTSAIYRVPTRPVRGVSLPLVVRFSRVGEPVPADTVTLNQNLHAEFNSPFEEFSAVLQLRASPSSPARPRLLTKKPLAIFVPATRLELWQTGRQEGKFAAKHARHPEVALDIHRQYLLLYGWIDGLNAADAADALALRGQARDTFLAETTRRAMRELRLHGFRMLDIKPQHIVFRMRPNGSLLQRPDGEPAYALVDYELLERIAANEHPPAAGNAFPNE